MQNQTAQLVDKRVEKDLLSLASKESPGVTCKAMIALNKESMEILFQGSINIHIRKYTEGRAHF